MPKKRNFLGGMQNYNAQTGEYEPALKGPNGESPSGFKSFKKQDDKDESFDTVNKKRMGKGLGYDPRNRKESTKNHNDIINKINDQYGRNKLTKQEYHDAIDREVDRWNNEQQYWYEHEDTPNDKDVANQQEQRRKEFADNLDTFEDEIDNAEKELMTSGLDEEEFAKKIDLFKKELNQNYGAIGEDDYNRLKEKLDRFSRPTDDDFDANDEVTDDEISEHLADYQWQVTPKTTAGQYAQECADRLGISKERVFNIIKQQAPDQIKESSNMSKIIDALEEDYEYIDDDNSSFDRFNAKRMGKEDKSHKSAERKDKYGNPLVSDDAFKVGQKVAKEYLDQLNKGEGFETAKKSFVTLDGFRDAISDALEQEGLNPDYDLTYQDLNEIIGSVTGEEVDFEDYEGGGKGWTGKKYNGYIPQENKKPKLPF